MLSLGTLSIIALAVIFAVSPMVFVLAYFTISRSKTQKLHHCCRCHSEMFVDGAKVPPYYDPNLSLRGEQTLDGKSRSRASSLVPKDVSRTRSKIITHGRTREDVLLKKALMNPKTPQNHSLLKRSDNDFVFQRSCSTRKKPPRRVSAANPSLKLLFMIVSTFNNSTFRARILCFSL